MDITCTQLHLRAGCAQGRDPYGGHCSWHSHRPKTRHLIFGTWHLAHMVVLLSIANPFESASFLGNSPSLRQSIGELFGQ